MHKLIKFPFFLLLIAVFVTVASSRIIFSDNADDLFRYYSAYSEIDLTRIAVFFGIDNREIIFQLYNYFIYIIFGGVEARDYLLLMMIPTASAYILTLFQLKDMMRCSYLLVIFSILLPPVLMYDGQLIRQGMAFSFLFLYFFTERKWLRFVFFLVSIGVHSISIFFLIIYKFVYFIYSKIESKYTLIFLPSIFLFAILSPFSLKMVLNFLSYIPFINEKLGFLQDVGVDYKISPILILVLLLNVLFIFTYKPRSLREEKFYILINTIVIVAFFSLPYVQLADRFLTYLYFYLMFITYGVLTSLFGSKLHILYYMILGSLFSIIFIRYVTAVSNFALFNGYFL